jgi:hypothetical protein
MINDGAASLTVTVGSIPIVVKGLEQFNGKFVPFNTLSIVASGAWRFVVEDDGTSTGSASSNTTIANLLWRVRERITDTDVIEFENIELVGYLNDAIDWLSLQLVQANDPEAVIEATISDGTTVPATYHSLCGIFPVKITGNIFKILDGSATLDIRYFAVKSHISFVSASTSYDPMYSPFKPSYDTFLIQKTAIFALNRNADSTTQDEKILAQQFAGGNTNG